MVYNLIMKKFKYKFTKLITALIYAGIALSVAGFAVNLYYCIANGTKCIAPAEDGIMIMKILDAIYESARVGHEVAID